MRFTFQEIVFEFEAACLDLLRKQRQLSWTANEAGGQLFARLDGGTALVTTATTVARKSRGSRFSFWPDRMAEQTEINEQFAQGLHYVGDWHTHPEKAPQPSRTDIAKMGEIFRLSEYELPAMLMVIVGQGRWPGGLYVGAVTESGITRLHPAR